MQPDDFAVAVQVELNTLEEALGWRRQLDPARRRLEGDPKVWIEFVPR
jgi:hypothetical protein